MSQQHIPSSRRFVRFGIAASASVFLSLIGCHSPVSDVLESLLQEGSFFDDPPSPTPDAIFGWQEYPPTATTPIPVSERTLLADSSRQG